jgi:hypothetical protein
VTARLVLTGLGAAGLIVGAFLKWTRDIAGTDVSWRAVYQSTFGSTTDITRSLGGASILLGLIAVLGLIERSGWLTRLAGAVGVVGFILFVIQVERSSNHGLQVGSWLMLAGSILCLAAGMGAGRTVVVPVDE